MEKRIVVLISGNGSNLQAIIDACNSNEIPGNVVHVVSSKASAYGIERAKIASIPTSVISLKEYKENGKTREDFNSDLCSLVKSFNPDLIVLAGWMLILSESFVNKFVGKLINIHPALPGEFDGAHAIERAYSESKTNNRTKTGVMVHHVIAQVDRGDVILSKEIPILETDTLEMLEERIHETEHQILPLAIKKLLESKI
ncbi:hypothetical protein BB558_006743 [Smittium angustum]|uniref:phosphoribosylglycinamide formyltransferase 1 n=1 Tax=Smittium angustum TaxID=133377 RepID=A0A2U1IVH5_SMIAN|nr:hypothetical protein BB558_007248 [Smittium angustum]PVZ97314.1 hypothetical protein BB558_006743 [Smittium angustum]